MNNDPAPTGPILKSPPRVETVRFTYSAGDRPLQGYTIKRGIGRGGFGEVYYGTSDGGKDVALKLVQRNLEVELRGVGHCLNLKHLNLVGLYDIRQADDGGYWVVMEYVSGENLADVIDTQPHTRDRAAAQTKPGSPIPASHGGLPLDDVHRWIEGICTGVAYLHDRGIVHRDLKPANLFMEEGTVKIGDYGLSKFITASRRSGQTESVGTVHYMAPEIAGGRYGKEIDIYAAGVILYEMLTGNVPFDGESVGEILMKHLTVEADVAALPEPYQSVVARALAKDPEQRFASIDEMLTAIRGERVPDAPPPALPQPTPRAVAPQPVCALSATAPRAQSAGSSLSVPVSIRNVYGGFAEAHGILRLAEDALHLEYTVKDSFFGVIRSGVKQATVPLAEIASVDVRAGFATSLCVRTSNLFVLERIPEAKSGELRLRVARDQRPAARALAGAVNRQIGYADHETADEPSDAHASVRDFAAEAAFLRFFSAASRVFLGVVLAVGVGLLVSAMAHFVFDSSRRHPPPDVFYGMGAAFFTAAVAWHWLLRRQARTAWLGYPITLAYGTGVMLLQVPFAALYPPPVEVMVPLGSGCVISGLVGLVLLRTSRPAWLRLPLPPLLGFGFGSLVAGFGLLLAEKDPAIVLGLVSGVAAAVIAFFWMLHALPYMWRAGIAMIVPMALGMLAYWGAEKLLAADAPLPLLLAMGVGTLSFAGALLTLFLGPLALKRENSVPHADRISLP